VLRPVLPERYVFARATEACSVSVHHYRPRKTGPGFPVAVVIVDEVQQVVVERGIAAERQLRAAVQALVGRHLIRPEQAAGRRRYRLVDPFDTAWLRLSEPE